MGEAKIWQQYLRRRRRRGGGGVVGVLTTQFWVSDRHKNKYIEKGGYLYKGANI